MPMQWQLYEVTLTLGLDQKRDQKYTMQGKLQTADNMIFDKHGALIKRRGYLATDVATTLFGDTVDPYLMHLVNHNGELLVLGGSTMYAVLNADDGMPGDTALVTRGVAYRGNGWRQDVATSATGKAP